VTDKSRRRAPETKARPKGSGSFRALDERLFLAIAKIEAEGLKPEQAARVLADRGLVAGAGDPENKARRLARRYREFKCARNPSHRGGESCGVGAMSTRTSNTKATTPDLATKVAAQGNRIRALERTVARLLAAQEASAKVLQTNELMVTEALEVGADVMRTVMAMKERRGRGGEPLN
jgi:hypothetical protein